MPSYRSLGAVRSVLLACALLLLGPALASAATTNVVTIGPLAAHDGYYATIVDVGCGTATNQLSIRYTTGRSGVGGLAHVYDGPAPSACLLPRPGHPGRLVAHWPGVARLALRLTQAKGDSGAVLPLGCDGSVASGRDALASGVLHLAIHPGAFGQVEQTVAGANTMSVQSFSCGHVGAPAANAITLVASTAQSLLVVQQTASAGSVLALIDFAPDTPAAGVSGQLIAALQGNSDVFEAGPFLASARVGSVAPFSSGSLWFTALPACPGYSGALNGLLSGTLTINDPVLGSVAFVGSQAKTAAIEAGDSQPGSCNGIGY